MPGQRTQLVGQLVRELQRQEEIRRSGRPDAWS
jgi:hypothetical protein